MLVRVKDVRAAISNQLAAGTLRNFISQLLTEATIVDLK